MENLVTLGRKMYAFGTWNVRGLNKKEKKDKTFREIERENADIIVLTETKLKGIERKEHRNYVHLYSGVKAGHPRAGVCVLIKNNLSEKVKWKAVNERIITVEINIQGQKVTIIGVYWVNESDEKEVKIKFEETFKELLEKVNEEHELIILGDFNSKVGISTTSRVVGQFGDPRISNNGRRLISICEEFKLKIQNTFFYNEDIRKYTCYQKHKSSKSIIDFCITRQETTLNVHDVLAKWLDWGTDHLFLEATISFPGVKNIEKRVSNMHVEEEIDRAESKEYESNEFEEDESDESYSDSDEDESYSDSDEDESYSDSDVNKSDDDESDSYSYAVESDSDEMVLTMTDQMKKMNFI